MLLKPIKAKKLSSPIATGGAGVLFENEVQSSFVLLMLSKGVFSPIDNNAIIERGYKALQKIYY